MPQGLDDILANLKARRAALRQPPARSPEVLPAAGGNLELDQLIAKLKGTNTPETAAPPAGDTPEVPWWRRALATGARVGGSWLGAIGAGALATPETGGLGTIPAAMAGGAAGGAGGEALAEWIEGRKSINPTQVAAQGVIGALPLGKILKGPLLSLVAKGAMTGAASEGLTQSAETGKLPDMKTLERGALVGGAGGAAFRGIEHLIPALAKLRGHGAPIANAEGEALTVDRALPTTGPIEPVEGPANLGVGRAGAEPYRPTPRRSAADISATNARRYGTPRPEQPSPEGSVDIPGLPPAVRNLLPSQRTPTRSLESLPEGPEGAIDIPALPSSVRRLLPSQRTATRSAESLIESPADTGERITGSVGGRPTFPTLSAGEQLPLADAPSHFEVLDPSTSRLNASGDSAASMEAISRANGMKQAGTTRVIYNRGGLRRVVGNGVDAVDVFPARGETLVEEGPNGIRVIEDQGGRVPRQAPPVPVRETAAEPTPGGVMDLTPEGGAGRRQVAPAALFNEWLTRKKTDMDFTEDLPAFLSRKMQAQAEGPALRDLPSRERRLASESDAAYQRRLADANGEAGSASNELLARLGITAASAAGGSLLDREHPGRGALAGAAVGAGVPTLVRNPELLEKLRYFSMLSGPATQAKNVLGNVGAVSAHAAESALEGNTGRAGRVLKELFSPATVDAARASFTSPAHELEAGRWGSTTGPLGVPGRAMGAVDAGTKDALRRAGLSPEEAAVATFTAEPRSEFGQGVTSFHGRGGTFGRLALPFARTATNILERGVERLPGVGALPDVRKMTGASVKQAAIRQALGALAGLVGYETGAEDPYLAALAGPYALPYGVGAAVGKLAHGKRSTPLQKTKAALGSVSNAIPLPTDTLVTSPGQIPAQFVPNALPLLDPNPLPKGFKYDTSGKSVPEWLLNPTIAKIPGLNRALLKRKKATR